MKRLLLLLPLMLAAPTSAQVDPAVHEMCLKASDYKGCVVANQIEKTNKAIDVTNNGWAKYGPLQVHLTGQKRMDNGNFTYPAINSKGGVLYIAINCEKAKINATKSDGSWKSWMSPEFIFEKDIIIDTCTLESPDVALLIPNQELKPHKDRKALKAVFDGLKKFGDDMRRDAQLQMDRQRNCTTRLIGNTAYTNCY